MTILYYIGIIIAGCCLTRLYVIFYLQSSHRYYYNIVINVTQRLDGNLHFTYYYHKAG